jgi:serine/threonine-protein kinase
VRRFVVILLLVVVGCSDAAGSGAKTKPKPVRIAIPGPLAIAPDGALVVGDRGLRRVVRINVRTKRRTVIASGFASEPVGLGYDDLSRLYVSAGDRVYRIEGRRKVVVAGTGRRGHAGDGSAATQATLAGATGIDVDHNERIAIAEYDNWIRVVENDGRIVTVAGNGGTGYTGDGGRAVDALLGHPHDVVWRRDDVLVIADSHNGVLRRVDSTGRISTFASGLGAPIDVVGAPGDALFVADGGGRVLRVAPDGAVAQVARVSSPIAVAVDNNGNAYVSQLSLRRVVRVSPQGRVTPFVRR